MATMIPDPCPARATGGERRVHALLRDALPARFLGWHEPEVAGRYPDFIVLAPDFGLLLLEVKGWYVGQIRRADDHEVELHRGEGGEVRVEVHRHPARQVRDYLFALVDELARPEFAILRRHAGEHRGRPCFPFGFGVILTNITRAQLDDAGLSPVFPPGRTICRDELAAMEAGGGPATARRLGEFFAVNFPFDPMTDDQVRTLRGAIHREVVVRRRPATRASVPEGQPLLPGSVALDVLDAEQERLARAMGDGHRVVFGVAGSGKTVLLLARARILAGREAGRKVLILCYNKALAATLAEAVAGWDAPGGVEARHFHSWAARRTGLRSRPGEPFDAYEARLVAATLAGSAHLAEAEKYDAVLIDEGHDFEPDWFRCALGMLRGGAGGDLLVAVDGAQGVYGRDPGFTWKSVGVQAAGRSRELSRNYRNTRQILEFAWEVAQADLPGGAASETLVRVLPTKAARQGGPPEYRGCPTEAEEREAVARLVEGFRARGLADREIAVLYPRRERGRVDALCRRLRESSGVCWVSNEADPEGGVRSIARSGVRLMTIHASKGLEFAAVVLTGLDMLPSPIEPDPRRDGNLLYVGLTRATDHLAVTWAGAGAGRFVERVERSTRAVPSPG